MAILSQNCWQNIRSVSWVVACARKERRLFAGQCGEHEVPNRLTAESFRLFHSDKVKFVKGPDGKFTKLQITTRFFEKARRYHDFVFNPGGPRETTNQLNLWRGFGVKAKAGKWNVTIAGNEEWITPASSDERRFGVSADHKGDLAHFNALYAELNNGGLAAMLHDLLAFDLDGWHPRIGAPQTAGLQKQKAPSRRGVDRLVETIATAGAVAPTSSIAISP